ncbi:MAG: hypothetical protein RIK87_18520 [Fuerstiella sp.]
MKVGRRLTFQLTPLLDLLLIVIFAQYMEVRLNARSAQDQLQQQKVDLESSYQQRMAQLEQQYKERQGSLAATRERYSEHYESILQQHHQAGAALAKALNLPGTLMEQILRLRTSGQAADADRLQTAVDRMKQIVQSRGEEMLQFVLKYDEMQKHVSVWELYVQDNGQASFSDGEQTQLVSYRTQEEFVSRSFEASKAFTEPKPLVIILLSHGDAQAGQRRRATEGMPELVDQLRRDSGNTRWYDFSLMGFRPAGPLFNEAAAALPPRP